MPTHWTYLGVVADVGLSQGDILGRSPALLTILNEVHPWFCDEKYSGFLVTTQTCDLVIREGECKAQHINLVPFQPLSRLLKKFATNTCETFHGFLATESKGKLRELFGRIINQNEQSLGLFYLHSDLDVGISEPSVAQLRVGISLKADHYKVLQSARTGRLGEVFATKMGWLAGNLYSRVATRDWSESPKDQKTVERLLKDWLKESGDWVPRSWIRAGSGRREEFQGLPANEIRPKLEAIAPPTQNQKGITAATGVVTQLLSEAETEIKKQLSATLRSGNYHNLLVESLNLDKEKLQDSSVEAKPIVNPEQILQDLLTGMMSVVHEQLAKVQPKVAARLENNSVLKNCFREG